MKDLKAKINNQTWTVKAVDAFDRLLGIDDQLYSGTSASVIKTIAVRNDRPKEATRQLLIHELTHAFLFETDINKPRSGYSEEEVATFNELNAAEIVRIANEAIALWFGKGKTK